MSRRAGSLHRYDRTWQRSTAETSVCARVRTCTYGSVEMITCAPTPAYMRVHTGVSRSRPHLIRAALCPCLLPQVKEDVEFQYEQVTRFAQHQLDSMHNFDVELSPGVTAGQRIIPVSTAGCYVGTTNLNNLNNASIAAAGCLAAWHARACHSHPPTARASRTALYGYGTPFWFWVCAGAGRAFFARELCHHVRRHCRRRWRTLQDPLIGSFETPRFDRSLS